jgi:hypothetical protein
VDVDIAVADGATDGAADGAGVGVDTVVGEGVA